MRQSTSKLMIALAGVIIYPTSTALARTEAFDTGSLGRMARSHETCRADAFSGIRRSSLKLYLKVQHRLGHNAPGRNITCFGFHTKQGSRPATTKELRRWSTRLSAMLHPVTVAAGAGSGAPVSASLQAIAACESGGNPAAVSPGGLYRGKYQFSRATWTAMGGTGDPAQAPESVQDAMAAKLMAVSGAGQWPVCGR